MNVMFAPNYLKKTGFRGSNMVRLPTFFDALSLSLRQTLRHQKGQDACPDEIRNSSLMDPISSLFWGVGAIEIWPEAIGFRPDRLGLTLF